MSSFKIFYKYLRRDLLLAYRHRAELCLPWLFFILVTVLIPLAQNPDATILRSIGSGMIWIAALLATLLGLERLFRSDFEDGTLEQYLLSTQPLTVVVAGKIVAHWLVTGLPLILIAPVLAWMLQMPAHVIIPLLLSLLLGTPALSLLGAISMALVVGLRQGGMLLVLVTLPLYVPVLIFGASVVNQAMLNLPVQSELALLAAISVLALTLAPFATAFALRASVE